MVSERSPVKEERIPFQWLFLSWKVIFLVLLSFSTGEALPPAPPPPPELDKHLEAMAQFAKPSPMVRVPAGWFLMGTVRKDDDPFGLETQYDDTEFPQRRIWLDTYEIG
ncbi:MAG: hypothetical protein D6704_07105, partial [Nitrospirae bacterium]